MGGTIYVTPPNFHMSFAEGRLRLQPSDGEKPMVSVDRCLVALAEDIGSRAIGVVLSGTGMPRAAIARPRPSARWTRGF